MQVLDEYSTISILVVSYCCTTMSVLYCHFVSYKNYTTQVHSTQNDIITIQTFSANSEVWRVYQLRDLHLRLWWCHLGYQFLGLGHWWVGETAEDGSLDFRIFHEEILKWFPPQKKTFGECSGFLKWGPTFSDRHHAHNVLRHVRRWRLQDFCGHRELPLATSEAGDVCDQQLQQDEGAICAADARSGRAPFLSLTFGTGLHERITRVFYGVS